MLTVEDILDVLNSKGVTKEQFGAFFDRAILLTQRDAIDSAIANARKAQTDANQQAENVINTLTTQKAAVQVQIDEL